MATRKPVTGVTMQGGFYEDLTGILFDRQETWISEFAVSYAEHEGYPFRYILYDGKVQVFIRKTFNILNVYFSKKKKTV